MESVVVTGCAGFIGSHLAERLLKDGFRVIGIDNFDPYYSPELKRRNIDIFKGSGNFEFIEGSMGDSAVLERAFENVSAVYHLAASAGVRNSVKYPADYCRNDVHNTVMLLDHARKMNVRKFVFASSSSVYGEVPKSELPMHESVTPRPISPYALSKLQGEMWCRMFTELYGLDTAVLRYFTVYGPRQRPDEAFTKFIARTLAGKEIQIYGDGEQTRDFTYVGDIINGTILAAEKGGGVYNLGGGNRVSVNRMISVIGEVMGTQPRTVNVGKQPGDVSHTFADITKARNELGYEPEISLEEGTKKHVEWARQLTDSGFVFP